MTMFLTPFFWAAFKKRWRASQKDQGICFPSRHLHEFRKVRHLVMTTGKKDHMPFLEGFKGLQNQYSLPWSRYNTARP